MPESALFSLPKELRRAIYENVYHPTASTSRYGTPLLGPQPSKSLLLTCREMYSDAKEIYRHHHQAYWTVSKFHLEIAMLPPDEHVEEKLRSIPAADFAHTTQSFITKRFSAFDYWETLIRLIDNRGGWHKIWSDEGDLMHTREENTWLSYMMSSHRGAPDQEPVVVKHACEEELQAAFEKSSRGRGVPLRSQLFYLLEMDLVDEDASR